MAADALQTETAAARPGFGAGLRSFFGGFGFLLGNPSCWPLAAVPVLVALTITGLLSWAALEHVPGWVAAWIGPSSSKVVGVLAWLAKVAAGVVSVVVSFAIGLGLAQPLSGPALERIVRRVEATAGAPAWPPTSAFQDVSRSLQSVIVGLAFALPLLAVLFVVGVVFPPATVVTVPLKICVTAMMLAWDVCDYPLSIRGLPIGTRVSFMKRHVGAVFGIGACIALLSLVPCLVLFALPAAVAGAARLVVDLERWDRAQGGGQR